MGYDIYRGARRDPATGMHRGYVTFPGPASNCGWWNSWDETSYMVRASTSNRLIRCSELKEAQLGERGGSRRSI